MKMDRSFNAVPQRASARATFSYVHRAEVAVFPEPSLISCVDDGSSPPVRGLSALIDRVAARAATAVRMSPAEGLPLRFSIPLG